MFRVSRGWRKRLKENWQSLVVPALYPVLICHQIGRTHLQNARKYHLNILLFVLKLLIRYLYSLVLCIDACFRFKNRLRSSDAKDPTLGPGWSYMVDHGPYMDHVREYMSETEVHIVILS